MKKIFFTTSLILIMLLVSGCSMVNNGGNVSSDDDKKINMHYNKVENFDCQYLNDKTVAINDKYFVNINNDVYEYSLSKVFRDSGTNCSRIDTKGKVIVGVNHNGVYDKDYYLYMDNSYFEKNMKYDYEKAREYFLKKSFPNSTFQLWLITDFGIIVENNKLYYVTFDFDGNHDIRYEIVANSSENVVGIYGNSSELFHVETDSSYYDCSLEIINKGELEKYADAECEEKFVCTKMEDFDRNDVKKYLGDIVVLNNGDIYKYDVNKYSSNKYNGVSYSCKK